MADLTTTELHVTLGVLVVLRIGIWLSHLVVLPAMIRIMRLKFMEVIHRDLPQRRPIYQGLRL
jgi:hypothetical protein